MPTLSKCLLHEVGNIYACSWNACVRVAGYTQSTTVAAGAMKSESRLDIVAS